MLLRKFQIRWAAERRHILRSSADYKTVHAFSHSLDPKRMLTRDHIGQLIFTVRASNRYAH